MTNENFTGVDCSGSDGDVNRVLTISNTLVTSNSDFEVFVDGSFRHLNSDYIVEHKTSGTEITFLLELWDDQDITIVYFVSRVLPSTGTTGILPLDTQYINNEILSFGDSITIRTSSNLDFDLYGNAQVVLGDSKVSYTSGDDALISFYDSNWIAQTFTTGTSTIDVTSIKLKVKRTGTPSELTIAIKAIDVNSKPTGSNLSSGSLDYTNLLSNAETDWIVLPLSSYTLSANTTYALVIYTSGGDNSNKYEARIKTTGTYTGGNSLISSDSGSTWIVGTSDILFDLYGDTNTVAMVDILTQEDESVKSGQFQSGDKRFFFQNSESNISRGTRIKHSGNWYEIDSYDESSCGDVTYWIDAIAKKI